MPIHQLVTTLIQRHFADEDTIQLHISTAVVSAVLSVAVLWINVLT